MATDAYSHGPFAAVREEQVHLPYFNFATVPLSDNLRKSILTERQAAGYQGGSLLLPHGQARPHGFRQCRQPCAAQGSPSTAPGRSVALKAIFPQIGDIAFESEWYGQIA